MVEKHVARVLQLNYPNSIRPKVEGPDRPRLGNAIGKHRQSGDFCQGRGISLSNVEP